MTSSAVQAPDPDVLADAAEVFQLLATPGRLHLLWLLATDEVDVTTLARAVGGTKAATSQHLAKLRLAGWVDARRDGRRVLYRATDPHVITLVYQAVEHVLDRAAASGPEVPGIPGEVQPESSQPESSQPECRKSGASAREESEPARTGRR